MAQIREIKNRIVSVKKTQQITRAMKMIAGVKFRKAEEFLKQVRPYAAIIDQMVLSVATRNHSLKNEFYKKSTESKQKNLLLVISGDRGLCGNFNGSVLRWVQGHLSESESTTDCVFIGKKARSILEKKGVEVKAAYDNNGAEEDDLYFNKLAQELMAFYAEYDRVHIVFTRFINAVTREVEVKQLFPIVMDSDQKESEKPQADYLYEMNEEEVLEDLIQAYATSSLRHCLAESSVSEESARMTAMDAATNNADDMIRSLTLAYNRARQAGITTEIIEISSGAEALSSA